MKKWCTTLRAINNETGELATFGGQHIEALTMSMAQEWCNKNGLGYLTVIGELIMTIPCKEGSYEPDWVNAIDHENVHNN